MAVLVGFAGLAAGWAVAGWCVVALVALAANWPMSSARPGRGTEESSLSLEPVPSAENGHMDSLRVIAGALPDPVLLLDDDGNVIVVNQPARDVFEHIGLGGHVSSVIRNPRVLETIDYTRTSGDSVMIDYEHRVPIDRRFEMHIAYMGAVPTTLVLLRDLTRQEQVERMRADFVANASHELRTPLASVLGFIETLQGAARNDENARTEFLELMRSQAARMARLIDDLLSLNSIELNAHVRPSDMVDIGLVIAHVGEILEPAADDSGVVLKIDAPLGALAVQGDRDELIQVFQNLIENAIKYGQSGGRVDVTLEVVEDMISVAVQDHGPGIAAEHLPRITERFYRVNVTQSREKGGTGLGLAIVKHILNRHRARLNVESTPGQGARFSVLLPKPANDTDNTE